MLNNIFGNHIDNLQNALSKASERHSLLTNNLANVNTPGYQRKDIDFNITLQQEMDKDDLQPLDPPQLGGASKGGAVRMDGNGVDLEQEVMSIAQTEMRYQALTDMTANYFGNLKNVIREGK